MSDPRPAPTAGTMRRLIHKACRDQGSQSAWCDLHGVQKSNLNAFLRGDKTYAPQRAYAVLGFAQPRMAWGTLLKFRAAKRRFEARGAGA